MEALRTENRAATSAAPSAGRTVLLVAANSDFSNTLKVMLERASRDAAPVWPSGMELEKIKKYGDTAVYWLGVVAD